MANNPIVTCSRIPDDRLVPGGNGVYMQGSTSIVVGISKAPTFHSIRLLLSVEGLATPKEIVFGANTRNLTQAVTLALTQSGTVKIEMGPISAPCDIDPGCNFQIRVAPPVPEFFKSSEQEFLKVPGRGVVIPHLVKDRLKSRTEYLDRTEQQMGGDLQELDRLIAEYQKRSDVFAEVMDSREELDSSLLAQHIRWATDLGKRAKELHNRRVLWWRQRGQFYKYEEWLKDLHHYALRRRHW